MAHAGSRGRRRYLAENAPAAPLGAQDPNLFAKLPHSQQLKANRELQEIWTAETKAAAELAFDALAPTTPKFIARHSIRCRPACLP